MTVNAPSGSVSQTYAYDPSSKRLESITVNGITLMYSYDNNSNQIGGISAEASAGNGLNLGVSETFSPDSADGSRLGEISVATTTDAGHGNTNQQTVYDASYTYNNDNQRATDVVTQTDSDGNTTTQMLNYTYDPAQADALTQVTDGDGNVLYNYGYDASGNFTGNASLGSINSVNEYSNLTYNQRGDLTNDGTYTYGYDALDRLISVTPDSPSSGSTMERYGFDSEGRRLWENVYTWSGSWALSTTYHFVWSGDELVEELDGNNNVLQQYTWGPGANGSEQVIALTDFTGGSPHTDVLVYDASGNVAMMLDPATGEVVANYTYTPYGALVSATGPDAALNPWQGKGYFVDAQTPWLGWANPAIGYGTVRNTYYTGGFWMQRDPSGTAGGENPTQEDGGDPINFGDPDGTYAIPTTLDTPPPSTGPDSGQMLQRAFAARRAVIDSGATTPAQVDEAITNSYLAAQKLQAVTIQGQEQNVSYFGNLGNVISGLPSGYTQTLVNGQQSDAVAGYWDALTNAVSAGHGSSYGPSYGFQNDYNTGHTMGDGAGFVINAAITVSGVGGIAKGFEAIEAGGGLLRMMAGALNDGRMVPVIVQNGQAVIAAGATLVRAGVPATTAGNIVYQMTDSGGGAAPKGGDYESVRAAMKVGRCITHLLRR
jgi:YD repeat-containing protein